VIVQTSLAGRIIKRIGVAAALAMLPAVTAAGFLGLAAAPGLGMLAAFQVLRRTANYAIARPGREVLYTVLAREDKYKAKNLIDTFVYRAGDQAGAWFYAAARGLGLAAAGLAVVAIPASAVWGAIAFWLGRRQRRLEEVDEDRRLTIEDPKVRVEDRRLAVHDGQGLVQPEGQRR
jgi:AAA family ATP:ADP antiporter